MLKYFNRTTLKTLLCTSAAASPSHFLEFHTTTAINVPDYKIMKKLLNTNKKKKTHNYMDRPILPVATTFSKGVNEGKRSGSSRRANVLNKLFMRNITDIMSGGACSNAFVGHGIEVNRVRITPDYKSVHVFWVCNGSKSDEEISEILRSHAGQLRHELAQLHLVGMIPRIEFFKDKEYSKLLEVEQRLEVADLGEDHIPTTYLHKLKNSLQLNIPLDGSTREAIAKLDEDDQDDYDSSLPPMPQNVLGLSHDIIFEKIRSKMKKAQALHRSEPDVPIFTQTINATPIEFKNSKEQREVFREFLQKRRIEESKIKSAVDNNVRDDYDEDMFDDTGDSFDSLDKFLQGDQGDYVEEDEETR